LLIVKDHRTKYNRTEETLKKLDYEYEAMIDKRKNTKSAAVYAEVLQELDKYITFQLELIL